MKKMLYCCTLLSGGQCPFFSRSCISFNPLFPVPYLFGGGYVEGCARESLALLLDLLRLCGKEGSDPPQLPGVDRDPGMLHTHQQRQQSHLSPKGYTSYTNLADQIPLQYIKDLNWSIIYLFHMLVNNYVDVSIFCICPCDYISKVCVYPCRRRPRGSLRGAC